MHIHVPPCSQTCVLPHISLLTLPYVTTSACTGTMITQQIPCTGTMMTQQIPCTGTLMTQQIPYTPVVTKGHLYTIQCLAFEGASIRAQSYLLDSIWSKFDTDHEYRVQIDSISSEPYESVTCNYTNWSNVSIDSPYRRCTNCLQAFPFSAQCVCDVCFGMDTA